VISTTTSVSTTAVKIVSAAVNEPRTVIVRPSGNDLYIGGSDVTTDNGLLISMNTNFTVQIPQGEELWAIVSTGTHSVTVLTWAVETV